MTRSVYPVPGVWKYTFADWSKWQRDVAIDITATTPLNALIFKAGNGTCKDPRFDQYKRLAKDRGFPWGAYHFYEPNSNPIEQADFFASLLEDDYPTLEKAVFSDAEQNGDPTGERNCKGQIYEAFPQPVYFDNFVQYIIRLDSLIRHLSGIYSRATFVDRWFSKGLKTTKGIVLKVENRFIWLADYKNGEDSLTAKSKPSVPRDIKHWEGWQFSADKPYPNYRGMEFGVQSTCVDLNVANVQTDDEFFQVFGGYPRQSPPDQPDSFPKSIVITKTVAIREEPSKLEKQHGWALQGSVWTAYEVARESDGTPWFRISHDEERFKRWLCAVFTNQKPK